MGLAPVGDAKGCRAPGGSRPLRTSRSTSAKEGAGGAGAGAGSMARPGREHQEGGAGRAVPLEGRQTVPQLREGEAGDTRDTAGARPVLSALGAAPP